MLSEPEVGELLKKAMAKLEEANKDDLERSKGDVFFSAPSGRTMWAQSRCDTLKEVLGQEEGGNLMDRLLQRAMTARKVDHQLLCRSKHCSSEAVYWIDCDGHQCHVCRKCWESHKGHSEKFSYTELYGYAPLTFMSHWEEKLLKRIKRRTTRYDGKGHWKTQFDNHRTLRVWCPSPRSGKGKFLFNIGWGLWKLIGQFGSEFTQPNAIEDGFDTVDNFKNALAKANSISIREVNEHWWSVIRWVPSWMCGVKADPCTYWVDGGCQIVAPKVFYDGSKNELGCKSCVAKSDVNAELAAKHEEAVP